MAPSWLRVERVIAVREDEPWSFVGALGGILFVVWPGPRIPRAPFLEFRGQRSIILYCAHMPFLLFALRRFKDLHAQSPVDHYLVLLLFTFGIPLVQAFRCPQDRWLFEFPPLERRRVVALRHGLKRKLAGHRAGGSHRSAPVAAERIGPRPADRAGRGHPAGTPRQGGLKAQDKAGGRRREDDPRRRPPAFSSPLPRPWGRAGRTRPRAAVRAQPSAPGANWVR